MSGICDPASKPFALLGEKVLVGLFLGLGKEAPIDQIVPSWDGVLEIAEDRVDLSAG